MSPDPITSEHENSSEHDRKRPMRSRIPRQAAIAIVLLTLFVVEPAAAQNNAVCGTDKLPGMVEGFFQLTTTLGIVGFAVVWQADTLVEIFVLEPEQKKAFKRHKRSAMKSMIVIVVLGPLYTVAGSMMGLPMAECVNFVPW
ncbi:hypothetical protein ACFOZ7_14185 [Natribaculum luteum]|uniref:Uncharacterized protein n=1 Tax=Natribaculum luteum TaxID=1586232 RepID=A0ABD5P1W7_9EURY|nr:hypothetical protein [Natribaculum luteum]